MTIRLRQGALAIVLVCAAPANAQATLADRIGDLRQETTVRLALAENDETRAYDVDVEAAEGMVVLSGLVPTLGARDRVVALVTGLAGVRVVRSTLRLEGQPSEPLTDPVVFPEEAEMDVSEDGNVEAETPQQELNADGPTYYTVRNGDTLYGIARRHETTVSAISALNDLPSTTVRVGQRLRVR